MHLIDNKPDKPLPKPRGEWVLVRKEKRSLASGLHLPSGSDDSYNWFIHDLDKESAPDLDVGMRVELLPRRALAQGHMISDEHAILPLDCIIGVYA